MFLDSLGESCGQRPPGRGWATLLSFTLQAAGVALLVVVPLFHTGALPPLRFSAGLTAGPPLPAPPARPAEQKQVELVKPSAYLSETQLQQPIRIPKGVAKDAGPPPASSGSAAESLCKTALCVPGGIPSEVAAANPVLTELLRPPARPVPQDPSARRLLTSTVVEGLLIHRVQPSYPHLAQLTHVQGVVELRAVIGKDGRIEQLQLVRGHPLLAQAAIEAVRQWRYRPYMLNGVAVEVEAQITVNFRLDH